MSNKILHPDGATIPYVAVYGEGASGAAPGGGDTAHDAVDAGNPVLIGGHANVAAPAAVAENDRVRAWFGLKGEQMISLADASGIRMVTAAASTDALANATVGLVVDSRAHKYISTAWARDTYAISTSRIVSAAATTNGTSAKAAIGALYKITGLNVAAAIRFVKVYNKASAPTVGTDTPILTLAIPASQPFNFDFPGGFWFTIGLAYALTTGSADADTGALTAGDIVGLNVVYA